MKDLELQQLPPKLSMRMIGGSFVTPAKLEALLGPPSFIGTHEWREWWVCCPCGLEIVICSEYGMVIVAGEEDSELVHLAKHVGDAFELFAAPAHGPGRERRGGGWVVSRLDAAGNEVEVARFTRERSARCLAAQYEERPHHQTYLVELRGEPPPLPPPLAPKVGFTLVRQDDGGNRYPMLVERNPLRLEQLAERLNAEPRHKQTYFVEPP